VWPFAGLRRYLGVIYHLAVSSSLALIFISPTIKELFHRIFKAKSSFSVGGQLTMTSLIILITSFVLMDFLQRKAGDMRFDDFMSTKKFDLRWATYFILAISIIVFAPTPTFDNYYIQF
ncbi:MAG: hypothetical protein K2U26_14840, partial [Cyclobacteriaceae bacterium]|nr:hypothetical protein [Cyclobacteriaceae bacterium]